MGSQGVHFIFSCIARITSFGKKIALFGKTHLISNAMPIRSYLTMITLPVNQNDVVFFISPPNVYMSKTWLVPGTTGGYYVRWCQRAL